MKNLELAAMRQQQQRQQAADSQSAAPPVVSKPMPGSTDNLSRDELRRLEEERIRREDELEDMNGEM